MKRQLNEQLKANNWITKLLITKWIKHNNIIKALFLLPNHNITTFGKLKRLVSLGCLRQLDVTKDEKAGYSPSALFPSNYVLVSQLFASFLPSGPKEAVIGV